MSHHDGRDGRLVGLGAQKRRNIRGRAGDPRTFADGELVGGGCQAVSVAR